MRSVPILMLLLLAAGCGERNTKVQPEGQANASAERSAESGQDRALEAGRELIGKQAPAAVLHTIDGETIDLSKLYGREPVYLKFWATWCIPCREQMPGFEADFQRLRDRIATVAVNTGFNDSQEAVRDYRGKHGLHMPIAIDDGFLGTALNVRVTPQHVVIGRSGRILYVGHEADDRLRTALMQAIAERGSERTPIANALDPAVRAGGALAEVDRSFAAAAGFPVTGAIADAKPRVLLFFSPWCESYFQKSRPAYSAACRRVREDANRLAARGGAQWVGISSGLWTSAKDMQDYRSTNALRMPLYLDAGGRLFRAFGIQHVPTVIILDESGRVARRLAPSDDLEAAVRAAGARR